jgi:hypothetical protein
MFSEKIKKKNWFKDENHDRKNALEIFKKLAKRKIWSEKCLADRDKLLLPILRTCDHLCSHFCLY